MPRILWSGARPFSRVGIQVATSGQPGRAEPCGGGKMVHGCRVTCTRGFCWQGFGTGTPINLAACNLEESCTPPGTAGTVRFFPEGTWFLLRLWVSVRLGHLTGYKSIQRSIGGHFSKVEMVGDWPKNSPISFKAWFLFVQEATTVAAVEKRRSVGQAKRRGN